MAIAARPLFSPILETTQMQNIPQRVPLSFGSSVPTSGATRNGPALGFGSNVPTSGGGFADFFGFGASGLSFGETVTGGASLPGNVQTAGGFVRGDVDGGAPWQSLLAGASAALLEGIGGQRDAPAPQLQQAGFLQPAGPSPVVFYGLLAAAGFGLYMLVK